MTNLKDVVADFPKTSAYAVLDDFVRVCGVESVLAALAEIVAAEQPRAADGAYSCACGDVFPETPSCLVCGERVFTPRR